MHRHRHPSRHVHHEFGHDKREAPLAAIPTGISERRVAGGRIAVVVTIVAWVWYFGTWLSTSVINGRSINSRPMIEAVIYLLIVTMLTVSALAYLVTRLGFFYRARNHRRVPRAVMDEYFDERRPTLTVIVPSYREEARVVRTTLLSAALQSYGGTKVVLLVDDPPNPSRTGDRLLLEAARALPGEIAAMLSGPARHFAAQLATFSDRKRDDGALGLEDMLDLAGQVETAVEWLNDFADGYETVDHADVFFRDYVVRGLAASCAVDAAAIRAAAGQNIVLPRRRFIHFYRRLAETFEVEVRSFERKQYASLSHESNKAMNLNSYLGLMGGRYFDIDSSAGRVLVDAGDGVPDLVVDDPDYVLTLDVDSMLLPEYCERIVYLMEQSQNARVAVMQTPYSVYPGSATRLERIAGATTDLQHIVHQGLAHYDAVFWVGANAVLRKRALDDLAEVAYVDNWEIRRYVKDRTVIEDTESTIDLNIHGWTLANYPERLSYSSTPPDFGSLCIQRRRWANGGLLILPKLWRQVRAGRARGKRTRFGELFLRANYMASICWATISLIVLLAYPFNGQLVTPLLGLIALPYFAAMASDLKYCGYKRTDIVRVYGFNLILLAVNLAGVGASIVQAITGDKSVFGRTPKIQDRTTAGLMFVTLPYALVGLATYTFVRAYDFHRWEDAVYAAVNAALTVYAIAAYIGVRNSFTDMRIQLVARLYKPEKQPKSLAVKPTTVLANPIASDWSSVLQLTANGAVRGGRTLERPRPSFDIVPGAPPVTDGEIAVARLAPTAVAGPDGAAAAVAGDTATERRARSGHEPSPAPVAPQPFSEVDGGVDPGRPLHLRRRSPEPVHRHATRQRFLSDREVDALMRSMTEGRGLVLLLVSCGLRWSEAIGLQARHVNVLHGSITLGSGLVRDRGELVWRTKSHWVREINVPYFAVPDLEARVEGRGPEDFVFTNENGTVLDKDRWTKDVFEPATGRVAGLAGLAVHDLRHTFAANAIRLGATPEELQALLGHASVAVTIRRYGHLFDPRTLAATSGSGAGQPLELPSGAP